MTVRKDIAAGRTKPVLPVRRLSIEIRASETHCLTWWPDPKKRCPHYEDLDDARRLPECVAAEERDA